MFDFEKLTIYPKAKNFNTLASPICENKSLDRVTSNQLRRAALSIPLNIAEGTSRFSKADKRNFYVIARGSAFECVAIFDILKDNQKITDEVFSDLYKKGGELSRILFAMIKGLE